MARRRRTPTIYHEKKIDVTQNVTRNEAKKISMGSCILSVRSNFIFIFFPLYIQLRFFFSNEIKIVLSSGFTFFPSHEARRVSQALFCDKDGEHTGATGAVRACTITFLCVVSERVVGTKDGSRGGM